MSGVLVLTGGPRCLGGLTPGSKPKVSRRPRWLPSNAASGVTGALDGERRRIMAHGRRARRSR